MGFDIMTRAAGKARYLIAKMELGAAARARDEARLAEARRLDADEVGRRADARQAARGAGAPGSRP